MEPERTMTAGVTSAEAASCSSPCSDAVRDLLDWARSRGLELKNARAEKVEEGGRGIVATRDLEPHSEVLRIPLGLIMRSKRKIPGLSSTDVLALALLRERERKDKSPFDLYVRSLPGSYALLCHWSKPVARELQDRSFEQHHADLRDKLLENYKKLCAFGSGEGQTASLSCPTRFSFDEFLWATSTILSRSVYLPGTGDEAGGLCPIGDLFNYCPPAGPDPTGLPQAFVDHWERVMAGKKKRKRGESAFEGVSGSGVYDERTQSFVFKTGERCYKKGEQIFVTYGMYDNRSLIEIYGFLIEDNAQDSVRLDGVLPDSVLEDAALQLEGSSYEVYQNGFPGWDLLCLVRWKVACDQNAKDSAKWKQRILQGSPVSVALESKAFAFLKEVLRTRLEMFPTRVEEDEKILNDLSSDDGGEAEDETMKLAVQWRLCQKRILHKSISNCELYQNFLTENPLVDLDLLA
ncbi:SET domain-containing protein [Chloropicon primus]|uniref:SET domain-containing protein n=1 Tax=Chloropicon primus TaxID=1764295 RepID=A0A5B8MUW2_9CHLO|nr:hypothetical protein A3770_10p58000 [Chloropicon primus]UPR02494.1 SET domain-containing protein [Chloropicon primus]|mmetsp:Transcript_837/g.1791  ORF Transcript_837/g.1791 Transcript_837/m.1791 type:complete len:464 (+) Transcript_837:572-1963(+)|eukprot:QDZ23282.1 hypothetical protein A3770_10p58000 [Chloropicon primus]